MNNTPDPTTTEAPYALSHIHTAALDYAARGWRVLPLYWPIASDTHTLICACSRGIDCGTSTGKHSLLDDWPTVASSNPQTITSWWARWPQANVGIIPDAHMAVLDVDPRNGGNRSLDALTDQHGPLPDTPLVLTGGGGQHYYFQCDTPLHTLILAPGIDFLTGDSHLLVAPPSVHGSSRCYLWEASSGLDDVPMAPLPPWLLALVQDCAHAYAQQAVTLPTVLPQIALDSLRISARMRHVILTGKAPEQPYYPSRSEALWAALLTLIRARYNDADIAAVLLDPAHGISDKPLTQRHSRSPLYWDLTRGWMAREIARARAKDAAMVQTVSTTHDPNTSTETPESQSTNTEEHQLEAPPRPDILINTEVTRIVDEAQAALLTMEGAPLIFQRARRLSMIAYGTRPPKWLHRPENMPVIIDASAAQLTERALQAAHWWKYDKRLKQWETALPPSWFVETLQGRPSWPFPPLEGIIASPTLRPDGSILATPGYDPDTGLYLDTNGTDFPPLPRRPHLDHARSAIGALQEAMTDFPFEHHWHFSAALAAILSLVCRCAVLGNIPLFAIRANTRGSGKSLLADVISIIGTGCAAPRWPQVKEDEEERKRLLTVALAGYPCLHIDNVVRPLGSPALDLALTSSTFSDRLLGKNDARTAPLNMVWLASGNNMQFADDTARRILPIDIDPRMEKPEERTGFQHDPLVPWVRQERPRLTVAALTIVHAYFTAGCPRQGVTPWGSFEAWSTLIREALIWAGEPDCNEGRKDIEAESNPAYEALAVLLETWQTCYGPEKKTLKQVVYDLDFYTQDASAPPDRWDDLREALAAYDRHFDGKRLNTRSIGNELIKVEGRPIDRKRLVKAGTYQRAVEWKIETLG